MSRFPDPRAPDPRYDAVRARTGQNQLAPQAQYPAQEFGSQPAWPQDTPQTSLYQQPTSSNGYANGQSSFGDQQAYGANGYGAQDPYAQSYGSSPDQGYPYSNGGYQQDVRGLPAPQPQPASTALMRPLSQQGGLSSYGAQGAGNRPLNGFGQQAPSAYPQPSQQPFAHPQHQPQAGQPQAQGYPASFGQRSPATHNPQSHPSTQSPTTAARRASIADFVQPRQDGQGAFSNWAQQPQLPSSVTAASRAPNGVPSQAMAAHQPASAARVQPQQDLYGLSHGFGTQSSYGAQPTAPAAYSPAFGSQQGGYPQQASNWGQGEDLARGAGAAQPGQIQDFGFEPAIDALGDSFAAREAIVGSGHATGFDQSYAEDDADELEGGRRGWKKIGFLLGLFIAVGGSLALAYNALLGSPSSSVQTASNPPVIKGDERPTKVKPSDPGGKQFSYTDSKMLGRVGEGGAPQATAGSSSGSGDVDPVTGARKVPVLTVGRDGSIQSGPAQPASDSQPPQASPAPVVPGQSAQTRAVVVVPGMTVIDGLGQKPFGAPATTASTSPPAQQAPAKASAAAPPQQQAQPQPQPQATKIITASEAPAKPVVVSPPAAEKKPAAPPKKAVVASTEGFGTTVTTPATSASAGPSPAVTGAGFVTVLASVPVSANSRDVAMKQFHDMQQKYASALTGKVADVVEANLGEKGTYHRLIAGPPGSKESANQLCSDLKAQGYTSCWVTAY